MPQLDPGQPINAGRTEAVSQKRKVLVVTEGPEGNNERVVTPQTRPSGMDSLDFTNERERLSELQGYAVLDTPTEGAFDDLTRLAAYICATPISLISLVDSERVWFKSKVGFTDSEIPRLGWFCSSAIQNGRLLIVPDNAADERFSSHAVVISSPKVRFYAGAPLVSPRGYRIGTLCVLDTEARRLNAEQTNALAILARTVVTQLELRISVKNNSVSRAVQLELQTHTEATVTQRTQQLALTNESLRTEILERTQAEKTLRDLSGRLMAIQDAERRRIARELHDTTGQVLAALSMNLTEMQQKSAPANSIKFGECIDLVVLASSEIRNLSYLLHPPLMDELGLHAAVLEYAKGFEARSGIQTAVEVSKDVGRLEGNCEIAFFRIIQEGLGNIHRHSSSRTASIKIFSAGENVVLEVCDQGRGLPDDAEGKLRYGVGIKSMEERLRQFGGTLEIFSDGKSGTTVKAVVPRQSCVTPPTTETT
jgi:signal transduction histidine kinase